MTQPGDHLDSEPLDAVIARAQAWIEDDPDSATRAQLADLVDAAAAGDEVARRELRDSFAGFLEFGTAGLRGRLGPGPNRMNRAVVIRAAAGLTSYLAKKAGPPTVVVGYDARHGSHDFALDTCAVVVAAGGRALLMPRPLPTPLLAFAIRHLGAHAGVMVTASHNPPADNGYKVYLGDGSQIVPPADAEIAAEIDAVSSVGSVPRRGGTSAAEIGAEVLDEAIVEDYVSAVSSLVGSGPRDLRVVHTSLHGVGHDLVQAVFAAAGFAAPIPVPEQRTPDPDFPTVAFPNPEEPGALDAALALAAAEGADLVIANDPDADRCAIAVPDPSRGEWRMLRGDELGAVLGARVIESGVAPTDVLARSIVSSRLLGAMASTAGCRGAETLTGFKWISRAPGLRYGYEEAIGYCLAPQLVRDKDGVSAALVIADFAAHLKAQGRTVIDVLDDLARRHGVHATDAFSVRVADLALIDDIMARLRSAPPRSAGEVAVVRVDDLAMGADGLPPTEGLRFFFADDTRVIVRPSGTEPKLKVYLEAIVPVTDLGLEAARVQAATRLASVRAVFEQHTAL